MPGRGTPHAGIRVPAQLWEQFLVVTHANGTDRSTVLRAFIRWYVKEQGAKLPPRP